MEKLPAEFSFITKVIEGLQFTFPEKRNVFYVIFCLETTFDLKIEMETKLIPNKMNVINQFLLIRLIKKKKQKNTIYCFTKNFIRS